MHICVVTEECPSKEYSIYPFTEQLCKALSCEDIKVSVISPQSITKSIFRGIPFKKIKSSISNTKSNIIDVYRPLTISFGSILFLNKLNSLLFSIAIHRGFRRIHNRPDVIYAHFWHNGLIAYKALHKYGLPLFIASGECDIDEILINKNKLIHDFISYVKGVICVSTKNKNASILLELADEEKCIVLPNGINSNLFYKKDKIKCREILGINKDDFIVAFVGSFEERKGANRVADAISKLHDKCIKSIFIGKTLDGTTPYLPLCDGILYCGSLSHNKVPDYLNCADIFVLPTLSEGCSNSIIEALGCGLPVISSNLPFNTDILNESNSVLIDPNNIEEIASAIIELKDNPVKRDKLSQGALDTARNLCIEMRASNIFEFIQSKIP
ncbi:MAG: glycosyltransferase family 4 protein [Deltaproteobacteria bacterium]